MINLTIGTQEERKTVIVEDVNQPVAQILSDNNVILTDATLIYLNGDQLVRSELNDSLIDLEIIDGGSAMLTTVVKATANK